MITQTDVDRLKRTVNLIELAGRLVALKRHTGNKEFEGACPKCAGVDRFHVTKDWFFCRQCHEERGDCIEFMRWLHGVDFLAACAMLDGSLAQPTPPTPTSHTTAKPKPVTKPAWPDATWLRKAEAEHKAARQRLKGAPNPGETYLHDRAIDGLASDAWQLGFAAAWDNRLRRTRPAIALPWFAPDGTLSSLRFRFIDDPPANMGRYTSLAGGHPILFGLHRIQGRDTLLITEGELNAISIGCAAQELDAISVGHEGGLRCLDTRAAILELVPQYQRIIVWHDKPERLEEAMLLMPHAYGLCSPVVDGEKLDANELLRRGLLVDFLTTALEDFKSKPAREAPRELAPEPTWRIERTPETISIHIHDSVWAWRQAHGLEV